MARRNRRGRRYALGETARGSGFARRELAMRSTFRKLVNAHLAIRSGGRVVRMCWSLRAYVLKIYIELGLELIGWPPSLPFTNLSNKELTGRARIGLLLTLWETGQMGFVAVPDEDRRAAVKNPLLAAPSERHSGIPERAARSDCGERRLRPVSDPMNFPQLPKSAAIVTDVVEAEVDEECRREVEEISEFPDEESWRMARQVERGRRMYRAMMSDSESSISECQWTVY